MIIGLCGYAGAGKDTAAAVLVRDYEYRRVAFADKLKELAYRIGPSDLRSEVDRCGWGPAKRYWREYLQLLGESVRDSLGENAWVDAAIDQYLIYEDDGFPYLPLWPNLVFTDVRYANEAATIGRHGGVIIRIDREDVGPANGHASERLDFDVDAVVLNAGTPELLAREILAEAKLAQRVKECQQ